jgi:hypothetical protein
MPLCGAVAIDSDEAAEYRAVASVAYSNLLPAATPGSPSEFMRARMRCPTIRSINRTTRTSFLRPHLCSDFFD